MMATTSHNGVETERIVYANDASKNKKRCDSLSLPYNNHTVTATYNLRSFIPLNLWKQYHRVANIYFTVLILMQFISVISPYSPYTTLVPFLIILIISMVIDFTDDLIKIRADRETNLRRVCILNSDGKWLETTWSQLHVGDIVKLEQDEHVPADILIFNVDSEAGVVFVETKDLDGETNLKRRAPLTSTQGLSTPEALARIKGTFKTDIPNVKLATLNGNFSRDASDREIVGPDNVLLRGCTIRNTRTVHGLVFYAGSDTKLMKNGGKAKPKHTQLDASMNALIIKIALGVLTMAIVAAIFNRVYTSFRARDFREAYNFADGDTYDDDDVTAVLTFFTYLITLSQIVPISLYVSVELIRGIQSTLIDWDTEMYDEATDTPAMARTRSLTEELGQIEYIMSDKTGTLTANIMEFHSCTVDGIRYVRDETGIGGWMSAELTESMVRKDTATANFFKCMAICHTVQVDNTKNPPSYQAQSPDEKALVEAARDVGYTFENDNANVVRITVDGKIQEYRRLAIIEFDSTRKRMSVIVETPDNEVILYTKGADNVMFERISQEAKDEDEATMQQHLDDFARTGLRTLVFGYRKMAKVELDQWIRKYEDALAEMDDDLREKKTLEATEELECNLSLLGASAIEDKLQEDVPRTIEQIRLAGIKLWVLTGDKQETAINIGYSCKLLVEEMMIHIVNGSELSQALDLMEKATREIQNNREKQHALVIDGPTLGLILVPKDSVMEDWSDQQIADQIDAQEKFLAVATHCEALICCRVSPLQKAMIVRVVKKHVNATTLAIGDGANDVNMIRAADIGVGISGLEGRQAVTASDYSISQFRFLQRLLLVHGRWSYYRMAIFMKYFFYKNVACFLVQFWYMFNNAASSQTILDPTFITMFNVAYTSLPIIVVGTLEQDVDDKASLEFPVLYKAGILHFYYDEFASFHSLGKGVIHSLIIYWMVMGIAYSGGGIDSSGVDQADLRTISYVMTLTIVFVANLQLAMELKNWMWAVWTTIIAGPVFYLLMTGVVYQWSGVFGEECIRDREENCFMSIYYGVFYRAHTHGFLYQVVVLVNVICLLPQHYFQFLRTYMDPTPADLVREYTILCSPDWFTRAVRGNFQQTSESAYESSGDVKPDKRSLTDVAGGQTATTNANAESNRETNSSFVGVTLKESMV